MSASNNKYWVGSENHRIRLSEVDETRTVTLPALVGLIQEVAWNNSVNLNCSAYDLMKHGVTWVVYRMQISIKKYPKHQDLLTAQSWPSSMDRLYTYRDYRINDEQGNEILRATSAWLVMDIYKRELVSVPEFIRKGLDFEQDYDRLELDRSKLKSVSQGEGNYDVTVRKFDMDVNKHVSNTLYFQWLLEGMGERLNDDMRVQYIDIQFKGEGKKGDELSVLFEGIGEGEFTHQIVNKNSGNELIRARSVFI